MNKSDEILKLQSEDPLALAETLTGKSYKDSRATGYLSLLMQMEKGSALKKLLTEVDDTTFSETMEEYMRKVQNFGFKIIHQEQFRAEGYEKEQIDEVHYCLWHDELSILLTTGSYRGNRNSATYYYNWSPNSLTNGKSLTSSGHYYSMQLNDKWEEIEYLIPEPKWDNEEQSCDEFSKMSSEYNRIRNEWRKQNGLRILWVGDNDGREAIITTISKMAEKGRFLKNWKEVMFLWLVNYTEVKEPGYSYKEINKKKIAQFPQYVKDCMGIK